MSEPGSKPFLGIVFDCCGVYARVYVNRDGTAYTGRCPRCGKSIVVRIAEDGSADRFLRVT